MENLTKIRFMCSNYAFTDILSLLAKDPHIISIGVTKEDGTITIICDYESYPEAKECKEGHCYDR